MKKISLASSFLVGCLFATQAMAATYPMEMILTSLDFDDGDYIPNELKCTQLGVQSGISPSLKWVHVPDDTRSFVLLMEDPDSSIGTWVHWAVYNIPGDAREFDRGNFKGIGGENNWKNGNYGGPCPRVGTGLHHYIFTLYALDTKLPFSHVTPVPEIRKAMENHILDKAELVGLADAPEK